VSRSKVIVGSTGSQIDARDKRKGEAAGNTQVENLTPPREKVKENSVRATVLSSKRIRLALESTAIFVKH
jgi:hypothetical protein